MMLPEPYYERDGITIFCGDCREILPRLKRSSVDLVLTDPPFFMPAVHYQSRNMQQRSWGDTSILSTFWAATLDLAVPLIKPTGHFITFCDGQSYPVFYPEMYRRFDSLACLVWVKQNFGMGRVWRRQHELVIAARWSESEFPGEDGSRSDVLNAKATTAALRDHPVEKPTSILRDLIVTTTPSGGLVLDPFMGGGSALQAARETGRRAIGIETERRYCEAAVARLSQAMLPLEIPA